MNFVWQMVPRYHPQISIWDILWCMLAHTSERPPIVKGLELEGKEDRLFWLNSATSGLNVMLKALKLPHGSGVGVPVYTCVSVFEAIASAGLRCVFLDIDPETFSLDLESLRHKREKMAALVMIHTFGFPGDVAAVKRILDGRPIIEDCSHAFGSTHQGRPVGLCGVAGIFSFNCHKPFSASGGGLLVVNDRLSVSHVQSVLHKVPGPKRWPGLKPTFKQVIKTVLYRPPWYGLAIAAGFLNLRRDGALQAKVKIESMSQLNRALLQSNLMSLESRWAKQRAWAREISELAGNPVPACRFVCAGESWNGYLWPLLLTTPAQREASLDYFHKHKVDAFVLWSECLRTASRFGYQTSECPRFEDAFQRLFMLPCYAELTDSQRKHMRWVVQTWRNKIFGVAG